jgi:hypothetical protein
MGMKHIEKLTHAHLVLHGHLLRRNSILYQWEALYEKMDSIDTHTPEEKRHKTGLKSITSAPVCVCGSAPEVGGLSMEADSAQWWV